MFPLVDFLLFPSQVFVEVVLSLLLNYTLGLVYVPLQSPLWFRQREMRTGEITKLQLQLQTVLNRQGYSEHNF